MIKDLVIDFGNVQNEEEVRLFVKELIASLYAGDTESGPKLSKKGTYRVYYTIHDSAPDGVISLENEEVNTIQMGHLVRKRSEMIKSQKEHMKTDAKFRKSVEERVKIYLGDL